MGLLGKVMWPVGMLLAAIRFVLGALIGSFSWAPPAWLRYLGRKLAPTTRWARSNRRAAAASSLALIILAGGLGGAAYWYKHRPRPVATRFEITAPALTQHEDNNKTKVFPCTIKFLRSAAPLAMIGKPVSRGISISPPIGGAWKWVSDRELAFTPGTDWPPGQEFTVTMAEDGLLADHIRLAGYEFKFKTAPFTANISEAEFYLDPVDPSVKKAEATVAFSHPVDPGELEKRVSLLMVSGKAVVSSEPVKYGFKISYDKLKLHGYIHSDPLGVPDKDGSLRIIVGPGVRAASGGPATTAGSEKIVNIPGLYSNLRITSAKLELVRNQRSEPEQVLILTTSVPTDEREIGKSVRAFLLPEFDRAGEKTAPRKPFDWTGPEAAIDSETLSASPPLKLDQIPNEKEFGTVFSFKLNADVGRYLFIHVPKGIKSFGGYILANDSDTTVKVPPFPGELKILAEGSLLSMSGEKKISVLSRDYPAVLFEVGRVLPDQMQHLAALNSGRFSKPTRDSCIGADDISERFTEVRRLPDTGPGKARYEAFDFSKYLENGGEVRRGCFLFTAQGYDPVKKSPQGERDSRLILVTDLGLLVKDNVDGTHDFFVESIHDGGPVEGAIVKVVGKNGLEVLSAKTGPDGHAHFPDLSDFTREKAPVMYLAEKSGDMSFLPVNREDRRLNMSRFDVGGVADSESADRLNAFLFSDRGVYRPGDEFRIGMIVKSGDWRGDLAGIPLEATVTDARGLVVSRKKIKLSASGFEEMRYLTRQASPTGTYTINLYVVKDDRQGGLLGSATVQVREFLPDRMTIGVRLSAQSPEGWVSPEKLQGLVTLRNLFGTPAAGRVVSAALTLDPATPKFKKFSDYNFFDPYRAKQSYQEDLENAKTNDKGEASFDFNLGRFSSATYLLRLDATGFEAEGGRGVAGEASVLVSPDKRLIGYKADGNLEYIDKDAGRSVEFIAIDPKVERSAAPDLKLVLVSCKYVSVLTKQKSGLYKYQSVKKEETLKEEPMSIPAEGFRRTLSTGLPGDYALVVKDARGTELNRVEYTVAGQGNIARSLEKNAELQLSLNKTDCVPGEEIEVSIRAPYTGAGLITVERDKVYAFQWFKADTNNTVQRVRIPEGLEGNGYISVAFIRDINSKEIFMSPLSYGAAPFSVSVEKRKLKIDIECDDLAKPGRPYTIGYKTDRPARIVIFAVDAGILQVARYKTPDPLGYFFRKRELGVKTSQILDLILPEYARLMEVSAPGGGDGDQAEAGHLNPFKRKHEAPVAFWSGIVDSDATRRQVVFNVPDYFNGTMKVMAVAVSPDAIGAFEKDAVIRGDFVISPNVPTFVAPGDDFVVSVSVANNVRGSGNAPMVSVGLKTSEQLEIIGPSRVDLSIGEMREASARFHLRAKPLLGAAKLSFTASMGDKSGGYATEMSIRPPVPYRTTVEAGFFRNGQREVPITRALYPQFRTLRAGMSNLPLGLARGLLGYLEKFPYGCTEQLISQAMPAIVLYNRPEFGFAPEQSEKTLAKIISLLRTRQNGEGAFGLWAADSEVSEFASVYAVDFLLEAKERNFPVPTDMLASSLNHLRQLAASEGQDLPGERVRAYAVYLLTRNGINTFNYVAALQNHLEALFPKVWKTDLAGIYMAATFKLLKQDAIADALIASSRPGQEVSPDYDHYYDGLIRDAQLTSILVRHFPERLSRLGGEDMLALVKPLQAGSFNTLSSSYAILALDDCARALKAGQGGKFTLSEALPGGVEKPLALPEGLFPEVNISGDASKIRFSSTGDLETFYTLTQSGFDKTPPGASISKGVEIEREYTDTKGKPLQSVKLGAEIEVHVKLRATGQNSVSNLAVVDMLPGGFEVSSLSPGSAKSTWKPDYTDAREDRVVFYGSADTSAQEYVYRIKAVNSGVYAVPPAFCESMYDRSVQASSLGGKIEVTE